MINKRYFVYCILVASLFWQKSLLSVNDGFLGLAFSLQYETSQSSQAGLSSDDNDIRLPIVLNGASAFYDVITKITLVSDLTNISSYYQGDASFLDDKTIYEFSFANAELQYKLWQKYRIALFSGFGFGHRGFLKHGFQKPTYTLEVTPIIMSAWYITENFVFTNRVEVPIAAYKHHISKNFFYKISSEILFDPVGPVDNPNSYSSFYSLGIEFMQFDFTSDNISYSLTDIRPFIKVTILY